MLDFDPIMQRWRMHDLLRTLAHHVDGYSDDYESAHWAYTHALMPIFERIMQNYSAGNVHMQTGDQEFYRELPHRDYAWTWLMQQRDTDAGKSLICQWLLSLGSIGRTEYHRDILERLSIGIEAAQQSNNRHALGYLMWHVAEQYQRMGDLDNEYRYLIQAHDLLADAKNEVVYRLKNDLGVYYFQKGAEEQALVLFEEIYEFASKNESFNPSLATLVLNNMGTSYFNLYNVHRAQECYQQARVIAHKAGLLVDEARAAINLGGALLRTQDYDAAISITKQGLKIVESLNKQVGQAAAHQILACAYQMTQQPDLAASAWNRAQTLYTEVEAWLRLAGSQWSYGGVLLQVQQREQALELLRASVAFKQAQNLRYADRQAALLARIEAGAEWADVADEFDLW